MRSCRRRPLHLQQLGCIGGGAAQPPPQARSNGMEHRSHLPVTHTDNTPNVRGSGGLHAEAAQSLQNSIPEAAAAAAACLFEMGRGGPRMGVAKAAKMKPEPVSNIPTSPPALSQESVQVQSGSVKRRKCPHGRRPNVCKDCGGASICIHGRRRALCFDCRDNSMCMYRQQRNVCKECRGSAICEHGERRTRCKSSCDIPPVMTIPLPRNGMAVSPPLQFPAMIAALNGGFI